jgi:hypothetical protein
MTVPTAGAHPELLSDLIRECGLPPERIVVVVTAPGVALPEGVVRIECIGPPRIQEWWTRGIAAAERRGATAVAVLNDDIRLTPETLPALHTELQRTGATISSPSRPGVRDGVHKRPLIPYEPRLWGSIWVLDLSTGLRPDTRYVWWYGDNDLDLRARRHHGGVVLVPVEYEHVHPSTATFQRPELLAIAAKDGERFEREHHWLLRVSRFVTRWSSRLSRPSEDSE